MQECVSVKLPTSDTFINVTCNVRPSGHTENHEKSYICIMKLDNTKLETIKDYFRTRPVLKAYLFGSYVRGQADNQSDIDILVDLDYTQRIGLGFAQMQIDL